MSLRSSHHAPRFLPRDGREVAWQLLEDFANGVIERLGDGLDRSDLPDERERALARELAFGVVRHQRLYDALAARFLRPGQQPPPLLLALRLAAHQLFALDRIPPHAAVDSSVELLRRRGHAKLTGVANAVIRRLAELRLDPRQADGPLGRLREDAVPTAPAVRHSLPDALVEDLRHITDPDEDRLLARLNQVPHLCTRSRPGMRVVGRSVVRQEGDWTWWEDPQEALRGVVADGRCVVQDHAQGRVVALSGARPGEWILDLCSAPGGKALAFTDRGCRVIASDLVAEKFARLRRNLGKAAAILAQDGRRPALAAAAFDVVLVDAPCSNTGVLGRRPEARWRYDRAHLEDLARLQSTLLIAASALVRSGGKLIYSTCSVSPRENQGIAHRLAGWRILGEESSWPDEWQGGGYVAVLVRSDG